MTAARFLPSSVSSSAPASCFCFLGKNRRKCKVLLYKHFYRHKYDYRQEWLKFSSCISSAKSFEAMQAAILAFYCETFARPAR